MVGVSVRLVGDADDRGDDCEQNLQKEAGFATRHGNTFEGRTDGWVLRFEYLLANQLRWRYSARMRSPLNMALV